MVPPYDKPRGVRFFSAQSPWNRPIPRDARVHPLSGQYIQRNLVAIDTKLQLNMDAWTMPVYFVDASTPVVDVECIYAKSHGDRPSFVDKSGKSWIVHTPQGVILKDVPIPPGALPDIAISLRPEINADAHLCIVDVQRRLEWDFCWMAKRDGRWIAGQGIVFDLDGDGVPPHYVGSGRASGFPLTAGLIFKDEIEAGVIEHPLVFAFPNPGQGHVYPPATCSDGPQPTEQYGLPEGALVQLDPTVDVDSLDLDRAGKTIARALQKYGMYCGDGAGGMPVYAEGFPFVEPDPWKGLMHPDSPVGVPVERLRVIDWGDRMFAERPKPHDERYYVVQDRHFPDVSLFPPLEGDDRRRVLGPLNAYRARYHLPPVS